MCINGSVTFQVCTVLVDYSFPKRINCIDSIDCDCGFKYLTAAEQFLCHDTSHVTLVTIHVKILVEGGCSPRVRVSSAARGRGGARVLREDLVVAEVELRRHGLVALLSQHVLAQPPLAGVPDDAARPRVARGLLVLLVLTLDVLRDGAAAALEGAGVVGGVPRYARYLEVETKRYSTSTYIYLEVQCGVNKLFTATFHSSVLHSYLDQQI